MTEPIAIRRAGPADAPALGTPSPSPGLPMVEYRLALG
jgi:hypothetical protein